MSEYIKMNEILARPYLSKYFRSLPLGYVSGYPVVTVKNGRVCAVVPFLRYRITGEKDKTQVFPICYLFTYAVKDQVIVSVEDLRENKAFEGVDFARPIGYFRHEAIQNLTKEEYREKQQELYALYDSFIAALIDGEKYPVQSLKKAQELFGLLVEPCLKPFYETLYPNFYKNIIKS